MLNPVGQAISEAMKFSMRLEERRGSIQSFDIRRLESMACPQKGNYLMYLSKEMLVAEICRDFERFDKAAQSFLSQSVSWELAANMSMTALFAFSPDMAKMMARRALDMAPGNGEVISFASDIAWFAGDLPLCTELRKRHERLGEEMDKKLTDQDTRRILEDAGVTEGEYQDLVAGLHALLREHLSGAMRDRVRLHFDTQHHEDGSEGLVLEVLSDMDDERLDALDDAVLEYGSDTGRWGYDLCRITTFLVRDLPQSSAEGAA
ncbi:hypothetical protein LCW13_06030 [Cobetia amphilecti]|uniref:hypothetical protein n=1 Tax=Cobetia amphilecti TaxID=1055104 RepID=UPI001CDAE6DF|nr:hypothetical protein [Cobetia amphilecti]UBU49812.1 hypothetical protein LCW13_06030 [Cobetia amphilecti]